MRMENLKAKAFDLRKDAVDIIVAGKGGHIGGDMSVMDILISLYFCLDECVTGSFRGSRSRPLCVKQGAFG